MPQQTMAEAERAALVHHGVEARSRLVDVDVLRGRAHVLTIGEGPPVVLVNGIGLPAAMWAPLLPHLAGHTLHAVDLPGFGSTDSPRPFTADLRANAVALIDEVAEAVGVDGPLTIVGSSLGSLVATWLALDRPDRVRALAHVGCPALALGTSAPLPMRLLSVAGLSEVLVRLQPPSPRQVEQVARMVGEDLSARPELRDLLVATGRQPHYRPTFLAMLRTLLRLRGARPAAALTVAQLGRVHQPVGLVWGDRDPFGDPDVAAAVSAALPDASLQIVPGGHAPWLDDPEAVGRALRPFLAAHAA